MSITGWSVRPEIVYANTYVSFNQEFRETVVVEIAILNGESVHICAVSLLKSSRENYLPKRKRF